MSKEAAELLLVHKNVADAVTITLDKSVMTAPEAMDFAQHISDDVVGKFLVGIKAIPTSKAM